MSTRRIRATLIMFCCILTLSACSMAPRGKTVILATPQARPTAAATAAPGALGYKKAHEIDLLALDQAGFFRMGVRTVYGWLDNNNLIAVGTAPVTQDDGAGLQLEENQTLAKDTFIKSTHLSTKGITGQILSVDWQTEATTELHTEQNTVFTSLGLSHDKTKLWYISIGEDGFSKLSQTDISFTHGMLNIPKYYGVENPAWSSLDKYLYYIRYTDEKKGTMQITLYDGKNNMSLPYNFFGSNFGLINIDDKSSTAYSVIKDSTIVNVPLTLLSKKPIYDSNIAYSDFNDARLKPVNIYKAAWIGSEYVLMLGQNNESQSLGILDINSGEPPHWLDGVINFAISDNAKYICLAKETMSKTVDISIAEWKDGQLKNETTIYKSFAATDSIYFSPDNTKVFLMGWKDYAKRPSAIVVQFR